MSEQSVLVKRTEDGKRGFADGYRQGWQWALEGIRRGLTPEQIEHDCRELERTIRATLED